MDFTDEQVTRYSRHILLPEVGGKGQKKLAKARVLIVGAGGLGSPAGLYLAAAGVGTLGVIDPDVVDLSNLQRQVIHYTPDLGRPKVISAKEKIQALNPDVHVVTYEDRLTSSNALSIVGAYDVVIDGVDNFPQNFSSTMPAISPTSLSCTAGFFDSKGASRPSFRKSRPAIVACSSSLPLREWSRAVRKRELSGFWPASLARYKRPRR